MTSLVIRCGLSHFLEQLGKLAIPSANGAVCKLCLSFLPSPISYNLLLPPTRANSNLSFLRGDEWRHLDSPISMTTGLWIRVEKNPCHSKAIVRAPWFTEEWWEGEEHEVEEFGSGGRIKARMKGMGNDPPEDHSIALLIVLCIRR